MANPATPLVGLFGRPQPEARLQRLWLGIRLRRQQRHEHGLARRQWRPIALAACSLAFFMVTWLVSRQHRAAVGERPLAVATSIAPIQAPQDVDFGLGAHVSVGAGAKLDVLEQSERAVVLALRRGLTQFDIRPGSGRRWRIESGGISVEVVGTQFSVERSESSVRVEVQRGRVLVRGPSVVDQVQSLDAGRSLSVSIAPLQPAKVEAPLATAAPKVESGKLSALGVAAPPAAAAKADTKTDGADWRQAATRHDWKAAWQSLGADGLAREVARTDDVADLLALADVARLTGHPNEALKPLRQIIGGHAEDPRSAMAAFTLGRVLLDSLGNPVQAGFAFERAIALKLPSSLAEDAQARLVEAYARAGAVAQARAAANVYRTRYPAGRRLTDVNHWSPPE